MKNQDVREPISVYSDSFRKFFKSASKALQIRQADMPSDIISSFTEAEMRQIAYEYHIFNGSPLDEVDDKITQNIQWYYWMTRKLEEALAYETALAHPTVKKSETSCDSTQLSQLKQFALGPIWDGNLLSKDARDKLVKCGYATRVDGFNMLTTDGAQVLINLGLLKQN